MPESVARRALIEGLLETGREEEVSRAVVQDPSLIPDVVRLLYHQDAVLRHRAATVLGQATRAHPERARPLLDRLMWALNDESGNHCPGAAVAIAEIALGRPDEAAGFLPVLLSALEEAESLVPVGGTSPLTEVLWAAGRLARTFPHVVAAFAPALLDLLSWPDPRVRALSARALLRLGSAIPKETLKRLLADTAEIEYVECGYLVRRTIRDLVLRETLAPCCANGTCRPGT